MRVDAGIREDVITGVIEVVRALDDEPINMSDLRRYNDEDMNRFTQSLAYDLLERGGFLSLAGLPALGG